MLGSRVSVSALDLHVKQQSYLSRTIRVSVRVRARARASALDLHVKQQSYN